VKACQEEWRANKATNQANGITEKADTVVWVNLHSKIYHYAGHKTYGKTKTGAYMCERDTAAQGMRASKNEKPPG
jgi:hypothetical protein